MESIWLLQVSARPPRHVAVSQPWAMHTHHATEPVRMRVQVRLGAYGDVRVCGCVWACVCLRARACAHGWVWVLVCECVHLRVRACA